MVHELSMYSFVSASYYSNCKPFHTVRNFDFHWLELQIHWMERRNWSSVHDYHSHFYYSYYDYYRYYGCHFHFHHVLVILQKVKCFTNLSFFFLWRSTWSFQDSTLLQMLIFILIDPYILWKWSSGNAKIEIEWFISKNIINEQKLRI